MINGPTHEVLGSEAVDASTPTKDLKPSIAGEDVGSTAAEPGHADDVVLEGEPMHEVVAEAGHDDGKSKGAKAEHAENIAQEAMDSEVASESGHRNGGRNISSEEGS